jgi:hypothetical protein
LVTVVPTGAKADLSPEQTFISESAEEATYDQWNAQWDRFDANKDIPSGGEDWWCRTMHEVHSGDHAVYCAKNGDNSHYYKNGVMCQDVNITGVNDDSQKSDVLRYDTGQDSIMRKALNTTARYYNTVTVTFSFYSDTGHSNAAQPGGSSVGYDFLNVIYYTGSGTSLTKHVAWTDTYAQATAKSWITQSVEIPSNATMVGFEFVSGTAAPEGGDATNAFAAEGITIRNGGMMEGVFLDDISVVGSDLKPAEDLATVVEPLSEYQNSLTFNVSWSDNDPQKAPLTHIMLYYRVNGEGDWTKYTTSLRPDGMFVASPIEFVAPREGTYEFFTRGVDSMSVVEPARNAADASTIIDLSNPATTIKFSGNGDGPNYKGTFSFSLSATDSVSGIGSIHYRINGGNWIEYASGVGIATNGTYRIDYYATDLAGNNESIKSSTIVLTEAQPGITIDDPVRSSNGDMVVNFTIALNGTTVTALEYSLDGGEFTPLDTADRSITLTGLSEGDHTLTIRATDSDGNVLENTKALSTKSGGLDSILSNPLVLVGIVAALAVIVVGAVWLVRRKK